MESIRAWIRLSIGLAVMSLAALVLAHLALTDIHRGEEDLTLEWTALRICFGVFFLFIAVSGQTLLRAYRTQNSQA